MKKHWSFLLGASLIAGSLFLKKKKNQPSENPATELYQCYTGNWWFVNKQKATQHTLKIDDQLSIIIDEKTLTYMLIELTNKRLVVQDEYGYHLIIQCIDAKPVSLYDEADDTTYVLEKMTDIDHSADKI